MSSPGRNIILFGPPGVGKGAQAAILSQRYGLVHLSTGEVIREEIAAGTALGKRVEEAVARGEYADDETVLGIVMSRIDRPDYQRGFLLDGFPRTFNQAKELDRAFLERDRKIDSVFFIVAPERILLERLAGRLTCSACGKTYHQRFHRPLNDMICDRCKQKVERRLDDDPETHRQRLRAYREKTAPLADYYRRAGVLFEIDGDQTIEAVAEDICRKLNGLKP